MAHEPIPPYPKNAPGPFYVQSECCIACSAPEQEAPDLMDHGEWPDGEEGYHCYFKRQPETPDEVERAISACVVSCVRAVRYAGNNPKILKRFRELRSEDSCDVLEGQTRPGVDPKLTVAERPETPLPSPSDRAHPLWDQEMDG
jgi:hypothetical protein